MISKRVITSNGILRKGSCMHKRLSLPVLLFTLFVTIITLTSCHFPQATAAPFLTSTAILSAATQTQELSQPTATALPTSTPTPTFTITPSQTPTPTHTPSFTPTATWVYNEAGQVVAPILLYHHVSDDVSYSRYRVSIPAFHAQMQALYDNGYTAITISMLLDALIDGRDLPNKPVVITFDDGHQSVYDNAFPIMQALGFPGVFYIVANRINGAQDFVDVDELKIMIDAGWEIGSHSYTHPDLTKNRASALYEIGQSKVDLQNALGVEISTFAYPFGAMDAFVAQKVNDYSYRAGIGLGTSITHTRGNIFYLERIEIQGDYSLETFYNLVIQE
jgi:peptidoglycan/xylan/chitin deacetylase (PgdA/CDA1 family)